MSYSITVRSEAGVLAVQSLGDVPDGDHVITGHVDATEQSIGVTLTDPAARLVVRVNSRSMKEH